MPDLVTYSQIIPKTQNSLIWEMAKESASVYNDAIKDWELGLDFEKMTIKKPNRVRSFLHSQSYQAASQKAVESVKSYYAALKKFKKSPDKFTGQPNSPRGNKFLFCIQFKQSAIRFKRGFLLLSSSKRDNPVKIRWNSKVGLPRFATIIMQDGEWVLNSVLEKPIEQKLDATDKILSIDLGVKRIAATHDGQNSVLYSGKPMLSLNRLHEKKKSDLSKARAKFKKGTRGNKKLQRGIRKQVRYIKNSKKDFLHKTSNAIVKEAIAIGVSKIVFGDCSSIHQSPDLGKQNNQKVSSNPEQVLRKYVSYKFERIGGATEVIPESYSSQTCPVCDHRHKPSNRVFKCPNCQFTYDRDALGALNINISFGKKSFKTLLAGRSGGLTPPIGMRFYPTGFKRTQDCRLTNFKSQLEEPTVLSTAFRR